jgi:RHS repeat-associated protein
LGTYSLAVSGGNLTATQTGTRYYFGGKLIKNKNGWVNADRLGSAGKYYPYGTDKGSGNPANGTEKFTGYQRDAETGLDYAVNRYEQPGTGRFLTADRITGNPSNPGSLNRYAYVGSDPVNKTDPEGTCSPEDDPPCFDTTGTAYANTCLDSYDWCDAFFVIGMPGVYGNPKPCCGVTAPTPAPAKAGNFFVAAGAWESGIAYVDADKKMQSTDCSNLIGSLVFPRIPATRGGPLPPAQVLDLGTWMGALGAEVIADGTSAAAGNVTMVSLTTGSLGAILQYGSQTVQEYISANPQTVALSELNGDMVYLNPAQIQLGDPAGLGAVALHEALHNVLGLDDAQLERALRPFGGTLGDPHSITDAISNHCL